MTFLSHKCENIRSLQDAYYLLISPCSYTNLISRFLDRPTDFLWISKIN